MPRFFDLLRSRGRLLSLAMLCAALPAAGQELRGTILDPAGVPVEGARVSLATASQSTVAAASTGLDGRFSLTASPGAFVLSVNKSGFAEHRQPLQLPLRPGAPLVIRLSVTPVVTAITVSAESSRVVAVDGAAQPMSVLTHDELRDRSPLMSDAAAGQTGVHVSKTSPSLGAVFVRGFTGKNVALFRDGVRYTTSAQRGGVSTFLNLLNPQSLESVEVLRGPNSAQYGSDSLGGAVSFFSRPVNFSPDGLNLWRSELGTLYQSANHGFGSNAMLGYSGARFAFQFDLAGQRSNTLRPGRGLDSHAAVTRFLGLPSTVFGERLPDTAFTAYGGAFHGQARLRGESNLVLHYERTQQDGGKRYDQLLGGDGNWIADLRNLMLDFGYLRYQRQRTGPFDQVSLTASFNAQREERVNQGGQGNPAGSITHQYEKTKVWGLQFLLSRRTGPLDWLLGGEGYRESIAAPSFSLNPVTNAVSLVRPRIPDGARYWMHGLYTQGVWDALRNGRLRLSGAARFGGASYRSRAAASPAVNGRPLWPDDSLAANALTGRLGAVAWLRGWLGIHANVSRGFRVPNVTDLGALGLQGNGAYETAAADLAGRGALIGDRADDQARSTGLPVERLRPETSRNFDTGLRFRSSRVNGSVGVFWLDFGNAIISQTLILPDGATGQPLGEQIIARQLASGAVYVPLSSGPVLVRANFSGARTRGVEQDLMARLTRNLQFTENLTYVYAEDSRTGLPPDLEPGIPPLTANLSLRFTPAFRRVWIEPYATLSGRQERLSSLALSDRRIGNQRSRSNIQSFFNNGARTRGLVVNGILLATNETLTQVQNRVLGSLSSAPQFVALPGYGVFGIRGGVGLGERTDLVADFSNLADHNYRGIGWGIDGAGRGVSLRLRHRF